MRAAWRYLRFHTASLLSIGVRGLTVLAGFAIAFVIGHRYGPAANGFYALVTQTAMFLSIFTVGGLDLSVVRDFSAAFARRQRPAMGSVVRLFASVFGLCAVVVVVILFAGDWFFDRFDGPRATPFVLLSLGTIFVSRAFTRLTSSFLRSQRLYVWSQVVEGLLIPVPVLVVIALGIAQGVDQILLATALAGLVAIAIGVGSSAARSRTGPDAFAVAVSGTFVTALPLWGVAIIKNFSDWYGLTIVGSNLSVAEAGLFRIATQVASALPIITVGIFGVFSPQMGSAYAQRDFAAIARLGRSATLLSIVLVLPMALVLLVAAGPILGLIGPEFVAARPVLQWLVAGQALYVATGPSGLALALTGHQRANLYLSLAAFAFLVIALPLAAFHFGLVGVGAALSFVLVAQNVASWMTVQRLLGINLFTGTHRAPGAVAS